MRAALRILFDVLVYRLRRLEMANMVAAVSLMLALRLSWSDTLVRSGFALGLNLLAYLTNDYYDVERDLSAGRDDPKTRFLSRNMGAALAAQLVLALVLAGLAAWRGGELLLALTLGAGICWVYSKWFKLVPYADVLSMMLWGAAMPLVGVPLENRLGLTLVAALALFSVCFESIQVLRDREHDAAIGVRTTGVALGPERTLLVVRLAIVVAAAYVALVLQRYAGLWLLVGLFVPLRGNEVNQYWNRIRLIFGLGWLAVLAHVYFNGRAFGWLFTN